ncbi:fused MFS/spermidine synthase [Patescibacteria group bacterium]|nr:fused MFS/spermidine synthase [Patescibacteria group bacterium]
MKYRLEIITFVSGALVMVLELVGSRFVAPYLGTSLFVWTSLIGTILASLSIGYWYGGKLADKYPYPHILSRILLLSAILSCSIIILGPLLSLVSDFPFGLRVSAVISSILLFSPVTITLGMVSPYVVRLKIQEVSTVGSAVGTLYALSTLGSIVGTFLGGFILISVFGTHAILIGISAMLFVLYLFSITMSKKKDRNGDKKIISFFIALFIIQGFFFFSENNSLADIDTDYSRWIIKDSYDAATQQRTRLLINNIFGTQSGIYISKPYELYFPYLHFFDLAESLKPDFKDTLLIGAGGYTYPTHFVSKYADKKLDVVEIDAELQEIAKEYFFYKDNPNVLVFEEDGRTFLNKNTKKYDAILVDAYSSQLSIPFHLTTLEAVQALQKSLTEDGVVIANIVSSLSGPGSSFVKASYKTYKEVFPHVIVLPVHAGTHGSNPQNIIFIASQQEIPTLPNFSTRIEEDQLISDIPILTDDFAPVEKYGEAMLENTYNKNLGS